MSSANSIKERAVKETNLFKILNSACLSKDSPKLMDKIGRNKKTKTKKNKVEVEWSFSLLFSNK